MVALLAIPLAIASSAALADPPSSASEPPAAASSSNGEALRYRVTVDAPKELRDTLAAAVDLVRWQTYEEMTDSLFDALRQKAIAQAQEAAATEGDTFPV